MVDLDDVVEIPWNTESELTAAAGRILVEDLFNKGGDGSASDGSADPRQFSGEQGSELGFALLNHGGEVIAVAKIMHKIGYKRAHLEALAVSREEQRKGHGRHFMIRLAGILRERGAMEMLVYPDTAAEEFYHKLGFTSRPQQVSFGELADLSALSKIDDLT